jgi:hypothetical protein
MKPPTLLPARPDSYYIHNGWNGWNDFLGRTPKNGPYSAEKEELLQMAASGFPRPSCKNHRLGKCLSYLTSSGSKSTYDHEFTEHLKSIRSDWFLSPGDASANKKKELIELAISGGAKPKPIKGHPQTIIYAYTNPSSDSYDESFTNQLKKIRPDWFREQSKKATIKKKALLKLAARGEPRPSSKQKGLGRGLSHYTQKTSSSYDQNFDYTIRNMRPDWFVTQTEQAAKNKAELIEMSKSCEHRPKPPHSLAYPLRSYITKSSTSYDPNFTATIKQVAPHWFRTKT